MHKLDLLSTSLLGNGAATQSTLQSLDVRLVQWCGRGDRHLDLSSVGSHQSGKLLCDPLCVAKSAVLSQHLEEVAGRLVARLADELLKALDLVRVRQGGVGDESLQLAGILAGCESLSDGAEVLVDGLECLVRLCQGSDVERGSVLACRESSKIPS